MNVLQVTIARSFPPQSGGDHRIHGIAKGLSAAGCNVQRIAHLGKLSEMYLDDDRGTRPQYCSISRWEAETDSNVQYQIYDYYHPIHDFFKTGNIIGIPPIGWHIKYRYHTPSKIKRLIQWSDVVLCERPFINFRRFKSDDNIIVYSSHNVESDFYETTDNKGEKSGIYSRIRSHIAGYIESEALDNADAVLATSTADADHFETTVPGKPTAVAPNAVNKRAIRDAYEKDNPEFLEQVGVPTDAVIGLFIGSDTPPNRAAVRRLYDIACEVEESGLKPFRILVAGTVGTIIPECETRLTKLGYVDDLEDVYDAADICLNPINEGSGSNIKLLDYLARGMPTVSTQFGVRGTEVANKKHALLTDIDGFSDAICQLHCQSKLAESISSGGMALVSENNTWETVGTDVYSLLTEWEQINVGTR
jgi:glycosyltransferase involved in cell wall biosynthesis